MHRKRIEARVETRTLQVGDVQSTNTSPDALACGAMRGNSSRGQLDGVYRSPTTPQRTHTLTCNQRFFNFGKSPRHLYRQNRGAKLFLDLRQRKNTAHLEIAVRIALYH